MSDREIKVGDRVCFKDDHHIHIVLDINDKGQYKVSGARGYWSACYFVHAECVKRKISFLRKLSNLLCEFDVEIVAHIGEDDKTHKDKPLMYMQIGDDVVNFEGSEGVCSINADNIMDFEKEGV